ncbi:MAG: hydantoinase B/oxoprolinase family protein, partial [Alphaproteobacteria bacterium]|nr:hydantoinase B/oxoprolinase family protein [Alphaproteobacteria bacterium]
LRALAAVVTGRSEKAMREAIRALPDGVYRSEITYRPLDAKLRLPIALKVDGDRIEIDFDGAPPQVPRGGVNCTLNYTSGHATYPLKCMLTPNVRGNAGCYRPFSVNAPEGSIVNARKPMSVNLRTRTGWYIAPNLFRALAQAAPDRVQAFTALPVANIFYGEDVGGRVYFDLLLVGGGQGGSQSADGHSCLLWPTSAANTPVELMESRIPMLVLEKTFAPDSGGAGRHRGGLGQRIRLRKLRDDGRTMQVGVYPECVGIRTDGLFGGTAGGEARGCLVDHAGKLLRDCGTGELVELKSANEIIELMIAGGAGYGDPAERSREALAADIAAGLVTREGARRDYGVDGDIPLEATRTVPAK